jgi:hypothetical protein
MRTRAESPSGCDGRAVKLSWVWGTLGPKYDDTRHNVGGGRSTGLATLVLRAFRSTGAALVWVGVREDEELLVMKPTTYMNRSGQALRPLGGRASTCPGISWSWWMTLRLDGRAGFVPREGSSGGHNGLRSISALLGTNDSPPPPWGGSTATGSGPGGVGAVADGSETTRTRVVAVIPEVEPTRSCGPGCARGSSRS